MDIDDANETQDIQEGFFLEKITDDDIERACLMKTHAREQWLTAVNLGYDIRLSKPEYIGVSVKKPLLLYILKACVFIRHALSMSSSVI